MRPRPGHGNGTSSDLSHRSCWLRDQMDYRIIKAATAPSIARRYREHMHKFSKMDPLAIWYEETRAENFIESLPKNLQKTVKKRIEKTAAHSGSEFDFPKLAGSVGGQIRISDQPPLIFHSP